MPRTARRYAIHLILSNGQREIVHFPSIDDFQKWYGEVLNASGGETFVNVPIQEFEGEYLVVRPSALIAIRVEPEFHGSDD